MCILLRKRGFISSPGLQPGPVLMRNAGCTENVSHHPAGDQVEGRKMHKLRLITTLMAVVAVLIIGIAAYVFTHSGSINMTTAIILVAVAVIGLFIIMGVIIMLMRSLIVKR